MQGNAPGRDLLVQAAQERWECFDTEQLRQVMAYLSDYGDDPQGHHDVCAVLINDLPQMSIRRQIRVALLRSARGDRRAYEQIEGAQHDATVEARARRHYQDRRGND